MREIRSYGSVGERGGNEPLYPEKWLLILLQAQPKSRQGWQNVATRPQPVDDGDDRIKPRGNIYRNDSNR